MAAIVPPEAVRSYPEPGGHVQCFGAELPASGILARHVRRLAVKNFTLECARPDARPAVWMQDIERGTVFIDNARSVSAHPLFQPIENVRAMKVRAPNVPPERLSRQPRPGRIPAKDPP